ncbi:hypothetical protein [Streptomyces sp. NPDC059080]|uniref:hypothetical protein n=1 Tax=Streptomyces sp. NPDC059080 TaxID=3346718 RepID=UPI00367FE582
MEQRETFTEQAGVTYATVGRGKRVHYSPRNDETLCGRLISAYEDLSSAVALFDKGYEPCATCHKGAEKRAEAARLGAASPLAAAVALAETVEQADAEQNDGARYRVIKAGSEYGAQPGTEYSVWDNHDGEMPVEATNQDDAEATAARLNREHAEARAAGPLAHRFRSTSGAYDATQCREHILDGDVLVIEREHVVGLLCGAWPGAITAVHGELHAFTADPRTIDDGEYAASIDLAEQVAREIGAPLAGEQRVVEGVVVEHAGTAEGSTPSNASHPDVAAARAALDGLAVATMTEHHDVTEPAEDEQNVRGYLVDPRTPGAVRVFWLEGGRIVRRDQMPHGPALDCLADRLRRRGWSVWPMLRSSQCVIVERPAEDTEPAPVTAAAIESASAALFRSGERVVCGDGNVRTVEGMTYRTNEPARVVIAGGAEWIASECSIAPACLHRITPCPDVSGDPVKACARKQPNQEAGVFNDEGCVEAYDCAVQAANRATEMNVRENAPAGDPLYVWDLLCVEHRDSEQQVDTCEECNADEAEAAGTWRERWIASKPAATDEALFALGDDAEQGSLFQ